MTVRVLNPLVAVEHTVPVVHDPHHVAVQEAPRTIVVVVSNASIQGQRALIGVVAELEQAHCESVGHTRFEADGLGRESRTCFDRKECFRTCADLH